jgi:hypothetical protein
MANIPLADIPNAPQQVSTPLADPHFIADQVGNEAKADINRSFEGMKVNPLAAAVGGEMYMKAAGQLTQAGNAIGEGIGHLAMMQNQKDYASGQIKFYQNKVTLDQQFQDATLGQPVEQHPVIYNQVYGENGANMYGGMTDREKLWQHMDVQHNYMLGMSAQVNAVGNFHRQEQASQAVGNFNNAIATGRIGDAIVINHTMGKNGYFSAAQVEQHDQIIANKNDVWNITNEIKANPLDNPWGKKLADAAASGSTIPEAPHLAPSDQRNLANFATIALNDQQYAIAAPLQGKIDAYQVTNPEILMQDEGFKKLDADHQGALLARIKNNNIGTPIGLANTLHGQQLLDSYPTATTAEGKIKELDDIHNWITANVAGDQGKVQQSALMKIRSDMASNGGNPDPDKVVISFGSQYLETAKKGGAFGAYPTPAEQLTTDGAARMLAIEQRVADIKQKLQGGYDYGHGKKPILSTDTMKEAIRVLMTPHENAKVTPQMKESFKDFLKRDFRDYWNAEPTPAATTAPSQAAVPGMIPVDAVASTYGYEKKGEAYFDTKSSKGIGDHDNKLHAMHSVGFSPEIKAAVKAAGIPKGGWMNIHFEGMDQPVMVRNDDTTDKSISKRVDFYQPAGVKANPYQDRKVIGISRV